MKKTTIYFDEVTDRRLADMSTRHGRSRSDLIRDAVDKIVAEDDPPRRKPRPLGASGVADTSHRVSEILTEGFSDGLAASSQEFSASRQEFGASSEEFSA